MITLRLFASLRDMVGKKEVQIAREEATLAELLEEFAHQYGERVRGFLFDNEGNLWRSIMLLINGEPADHSAKSKVKSGDVVSILLPTAGGW